MSELKALGVFVIDEEDTPSSALFPGPLTDRGAVLAYVKRQGGAPPVNEDLAYSYRAEPLPEPLKYGPEEDDDEGRLGVVGLAGSEADDLSETGWAILFGAKDPELNEKIKKQLKPLLDLRKSQAGEFYHEFDANNHPWQSGQSVEDWLGTFGDKSDKGISADDQVKPRKGVPFYIMIVAAPNDIPFEFQYRLDVYWAVGRLWLESIEDYGAYAEAVCADETATVPAATRTITYFAPEFRHDNGATKMVRYDLVEKLRESSLGDFDHTLITSPHASRDKLLELYTGHANRPALYFVGSHGALFNHAKGDSIARCMGAIVTDVWADQPPPEGQTEVPAPVKTQYVAGRDLSREVNLKGTIHILCACYGAGWPKVSSYNGEPVSDDGPGIAQLPQRLLAKGALAVLGHIDKAWTYSFVTSGGRDRSGKYEDVLIKLMKGRRAGNATDAFNYHWNVLASGFRDNTLGLSEKEKHDRRIEIDDARNYVLLGDPAVRLRTDLMPVIKPKTPRA